MPQIEDMVNQMDDIDAGSQHVHYIALKNAEPQDVQQILQDLFPAGSTQPLDHHAKQSAAATRSQTVSQNQLSSGVSSGVSSSSGSGTAPAAAAGDCKPEQ